MLFQGAIEEVFPDSPAIEEFHIIRNVLPKTFLV